MQPYFMPYIGYFQLMNAVDMFVVYDNIQFSKGGWVQRNRILMNGKDQLITLPLRKDSDFLDIRARYLSENFDSQRLKILRRIAAAYKKAPFFKEVYALIEECLMDDENNLFAFILHSFVVVKQYLDIKTPLVISSQIQMDHSLKAQERVLAACQALHADEYINLIGGVRLYDQLSFEEKKIKLSFLQTEDFSYQQFGETFVNFLSIIDVMMFNSRNDIHHLLGLYRLI